MIARKFINVVFPILVIIITLGYSSGPASSGRNVSSAPGDETCAASGCHGDTDAFDQVTSIHLTNVDGDTITDYRAGEKYNIIVNIVARTGAPGVFGFQLVNLIDGDNSSHDGWDGLPDNIGKVVLNDRTYIEHNSLSDSGTFVTEWTAPVEGSGAISFYASSNAADGNGGRSGDDIATANISLSEALTSSEASLSFDQDWTILENPTRHTLRFHTAGRMKAQYEVYDMTGRRLIAGTAFEGMNIVDIGRMKNGMYLIKLSDRLAQTYSIKRFIKS